MTRLTVLLWATGLAGGLATGADPASSPPTRVRHVGLLREDVLLVVLDDGAVEYAKQRPYQKRAGDQVDRSDHNRWLRRGGKTIGSLVGRSESILYGFDRVVGRRLKTDALDRAASYRLVAGKGPAGGRAVAVKAVWRKTRPTDVARIGPWQFDAPLRHEIVLVLVERLAAGTTYTLHTPGLSLPAQTFTAAAPDARSRAVHVSHIGFRPDDPAKVAFLSAWMGMGGGVTYKAGRTFRVVEGDTGRAAFTGRARLAKPASARDEDAYKNNHNLADVWEMDFTALDRPGRYRVCVDGIGCSAEFRIARDVWTKAFYVSARGFYHQRSGIALGPPYTEFRRPRCFRPADGVKVYHSDAPLMNCGGGLNHGKNNFEQLVAGRTNRIVANAWGAYMDAGDWDRRIQHLVATRRLLELADWFPQHYAGVSLHIPESRGALPDVVDEALFNLDGYRRMQTAAGGIRGGIESAEHPRHGEASWQESLTVMAYAPGVWSSYEYAATAAQAARVVKRWSADLAKTYAQSARRAFAWAEAERAKLERKTKLPNAVRDSRNLAAVELYALTGEKPYHDVFQATTAMTNDKAELYVWQKHTQPDAPWTYLQLPASRTDSGLRRRCRLALLREADQRAAHTQKTGYRWTKNPWRPTMAGTLSAPDAVSLVRAHRLTGERKYLAAAVLACQTGLGANPLDLCYTTGLGHDWPRHPLHVDSRVLGCPPPPGLTVFGPIDPKKTTQQWAEKFLRPFVFPPRADWPVIESYLDVCWYPMMCEYTIHQPMADNAYVWGYLAARK